MTLIAALTIKINLIMTMAVDSNKNTNNSGKKKILIITTH